MTQSSGLDLLSSVNFDSKLLFSVSQDLAIARSKCFRLPESENHVDVWSIKAPDFSPKLYKTLGVSQSKGRTRPTHHLLAPPSKKERTEGIFPKDLLEINKRTALLTFNALYRPPDALQSKLMFVKTGKYPSGHYKNPKQYNFRPLEEDLPNIVNASMQDYGNLIFKSEHLDIIYTAMCEPVLKSRDLLPRMDTYKPADPRWEAELILPKLTWPPKSASYTRHRQKRGAYSAFMDRVEEKLSMSWKNR